MTDFAADLSALLRRMPGLRTPAGDRADWFDRKAALLDRADAPDLAQVAREHSVRLRAG
ncbi:hypothetical protein [Actinoplanes sp. NPDC049599]|uniref:hypothetical protein n=1 Tax=Actinoplanes sp. NPDC049599 TaxID=3363903 RepID=UPI00379E32B6